MRRLILMALCLLPVPAAGQVVVTSPGAEATSVTIYRDPDRGEGGFDARAPQGFALISEQRRIALPAGDATVRFEGVADGMIAVSAVVTGLPGGVVQKNRDAYLLSPAALVDGSLGNRVHLRRTNRQTGKVVEQDAIIRSSADNALVLESADGVEGLRCSGLPETVTYDGVPQDLSATPTLSVSTSSAQAVEAQVTLTYLATGFDWGASYVARIAPDERTLDLFAWLTVANGNAMSFPESRLLAVAGRLNRSSQGGGQGGGQDDSPPAPYLDLQCWSLPSYVGPEDAYPPPPAPPAMMVPMAMQARSMEDVVVTAQRVARQEDLGDLKLYRVPMAVDVLANSQKQVALLQKAAIPFVSLYGASLSTVGDDGESAGLRLIIRFSNRRGGPLDAPLPSGGVALFAERDGQALLLADGRMRDHAIGEQVELDAGVSDQQRITQTALPSASGKPQAWQVAITNAAARAVDVEVTLAGMDDEAIGWSSARLGRKDGATLWKVRVPANGVARLDYRIKRKAP